MMSNQPELHDYLIFFEAEPKILNPEAGWLYGTEFISHRQSDYLTAIIAPGDGKMQFQWRQNETLRANIYLRYIVEWELDCTAKRETLLLKFSQPSIKFFLLQLKPTIYFSWETTLP